MNILKVVEELTWDYNTLHELWVEAKNNGNLELAESLLNDLIELNELYYAIYKSDIDREIRIRANQMWRAVTDK